jgi:hypothetical protein
VPRLDDEANGPIPPFDQTRRLQLNPNNPVVAALYTFVGPHVEALRQELVEERRQARQPEHARRLAQQGEEIARIINADFRDFRDRLSRRQGRAAGGFDLFIVPGNGAARALVPGNEIPGKPAEHGGAAAAGEQARQLAAPVQALLGGVGQGLAQRFSQ